VLCKPKQGAALRVRTVCERNEVTVDPIALGLQGPQGPGGPTGVAGPQGTMGVQGLPGPGSAIRDANNALVGAVVSIPNQGVPQDNLLLGPVTGAWVIRTVGASPPLLFWVTSQGFLNTGFDSNPTASPFILYFESSNCTGQPYFYTQPDSLANYAYVLGNTVYYLTSGPGAAGLIFSRLSGIGCDALGGVGLPTQPAAIETLEPLGLTPPFHVDTQ
jgi:hypothetical protein